MDPRSYYHIENDLCLASITYTKHWWFGVRWKYRCSFFEHMTLRPYKVVEGWKKELGETQQTVRDLFNKELETCRTSSPPGCSARSSSSTTA